jgi:hypothetical protein
LVRRQTLLADVVSVAAFEGGVSDPEFSAFTLVGLGGIVFGGPLVHLLNRNGSSAGISLAIRLGSFLSIGVGCIISVGERLGSDDDGDGSFGTTLAMLCTAN